MKKTFKTLSAVLLSTLALSLTSCGLWDKIQGPEKEWEQYDFTYTVGESEVDLTCYAMFSSTDTEFSTSTKANGTTRTFAPGLTLLICPSAEVAALEDLFGSSEFGTDNYVVKTFPLDEDIDISENEESTKTMKFTKTKWTVIYNAVKWSATNSDNASAILKTKTEFTDLSSSNFSWKEVLINVIVNNL